MAVWSAAVVSIVEVALELRHDNFSERVIVEVAASMERTERDESRG